MSTRLLILTASYGEGHNAAARALAEACLATHGPGSARVVDIFALASPRLNAVSRRGYIDLINRAPRLWSAVYAWIDRTDVMRVGLWFLRRERRLLAQIIATETPAAICSTYPIYAFLLARLAREGRKLPPHFNVVTDSISINSLWWRAGSAGWFLPNEDSAEVMRRAGINGSQLHVTGFPVPAFFGDNAPLLSPPDLSVVPPTQNSKPKTQNASAPRVLYIINSGTLHAEETARRLLAETDWDITIAVGRDEALRQKLIQRAVGRARPAQILGWTDQIPRLLMTHHVVISKAGGATTQEAIAARCPMIVNQIVPGQEEGNYELLRRHGAGALAETPDAALATLHQAFAQHGATWRKWRDALATLTRNDAARAIVTRILSEPEFTSHALPRFPGEKIPAPATNSRLLSAAAASHPINNHPAVVTLSATSSVPPATSREPVPVSMRASGAPAPAAGPSFA